MADDRQILADLKDQATDARLDLLRLEKEVVLLFRQKRATEDKQERKAIRKIIKETKASRKRAQARYSDLLKRIRPEVARIRKDIFQEYLLCLQQTQTENIRRLQPFIEANVRVVNTMDFTIGPIDLQVYKLHRKKPLYITGSIVRNQNFLNLLPEIDSTSSEVILDNYYIIYYNYTPHTLQKITQLWNCAIRVNRRYNGEYEPRMYVDETRGILGVTMSCTLPSWMNSILGQITPGFLWDPARNPRVLKDGRYLFRVSRVPESISERIINILKRQNSEKFSKIFGEVIYITSLDANGNTIPGTDNLERFLNDPLSTCARINWEEHARVIFKDSDTPEKLWISDPWMSVEQTNETVGFNTLINLLQEQGKTIEAVPRANFDQNDEEGSCAVFSLIRLCLISQYGYVGSVMPIPCEYAIFMQRLTKALMKENIFLQIPVDFTAIYDTIPKIMIDRFTRDYNFDNNILFFIGLFARDYPREFEATIVAINRPDSTDKLARAVSVASGLFKARNSVGIQEIFQRINDFANIDNRIFYEEIQVEIVGYKQKFDSRMGKIIQQSDFENYLANLPVSETEFETEIENLPEDSKAAIFCNLYKSIDN